MSPEGLPAAEMDERIRAIGERERARGNARAAQPVITRKVAPMARTYADKNCKRCGQRFTPTGPRNVYCCPAPAGSKNGGSERGKPRPVERGVPKAGESRSRPSGERPSLSRAEQSTELVPKPEADVRPTPELVVKPEGGGLSRPVGFADSAERYVCALVDHFENNAAAMPQAEFDALCDRIERHVGLS